MSEHHVRVIDHHSFPSLLRALSRARRDDPGNGIAPLLDRALTLAVIVDELRDAETLLLQHASRRLGVPCVPVRPEGSEPTAPASSIVLLGSFQQYLQLVEALKEERGPLSEVAGEIKGAIYRFREHTYEIPLPDDDVLPLGARTLVMGILNVTPDSFSDGGDHVSIDAAVAHGLRMVEEGADLLDVGGESTRPGAEPVPTADEVDRILPVIARLADQVEIPVSVDTRHGAVAREAVKVGARMINDVSGLDDPLMAAVAARSGAPIVVMHMRGTPSDMAEKAVYRDLMREVRSEIAGRVRRAIDAGVDEARILVDPGIGFAKTGPQSMELVSRLAELRNLGYPIVVGPSRKSFLTAIADVPPKERDHLTAGALAACVARGAHIVRVHDVRAAVHTVRAFEAMY